MDARNQPEAEFLSVLYDPAVHVDVELDRWAVEQAGGWPADERSVLGRVRDVLLDHLVRVVVFAGAVLILYAVLVILR